MFIAFSLFLAIVSTIFGNPSQTFFAVSLEKPFGFAWYDLEHFGPDTSINGVTVKPMVRSELNFPIDHVRFGLSITSLRSAVAQDELSFRTQGKIWFSVSPAFSKMRDEDWMGADASKSISNSQVLEKFSDTYSSVESFLVGAELNRDILQLHFLNEAVLLGCGLAGAFASFEIFGLEGKRLNGESGAVWVQSSLPASLLVGTYLTYTVQSNLTVKFIHPILNLYWEAKLHPLLHAYAFDDHILRKKHIVMNTWGTGGELEVSMPLKSWKSPTSNLSRFVPYLKMEMNRTWGDMDQTYYADSPDTPDNETGKSLDGISTKVSHWLIGAGVNFNFNL